MRAKSVNENIEFERGKDPKEILEIGEYRPEKLKEKILQMGPEIASKTEMGWMVTHNIDSGRIDWNYPFFYALTPEGVRALYLQIMEVVKQNESLDFERGLNPKKVMDIGLSKFAEYSLMNHYIGRGIDLAAKRIMIHEMKLSKNKIFFLGDTRDSHSEYIGKTYDYILNSDRTEEREVLNGNEYVATISFYDCPDGKACLLEFNDHGEFYGDFNLFRYLKTYENLEV